MLSYFVLVVIVMVSDLFTGLFLVLFVGLAGHEDSVISFLVGVDAFATDFFCTTGGLSGVVVHILPQFLCSAGTATTAGFVCFQCFFFIVELFVILFVHFFTTRIICD